MKKFILLFAALFGVLLLAWPAYAADIAVNSDCSLADAITAANKDEAVGGCSAGDGADTITLSADVVLSRALPLVTSEMTIEGAGYTIRGKDRFHIIGVHSRGNLTLNEVTITNGRSGWGGAIGNFGSLTITNSTISNNLADQGGAIGNEGSLTISDSTISDNSTEEGTGEGGTGGAIYNLGNFTVTDSIFNNNSASGLGGGGAIYIEDGTVNISSSSFNNNSTGDYGGGGAMMIEDGTVNISSSSFSGNKASYHGGAMHIEDGTVNISSSSFKDNATDSDGGAISNWRSNLTTINSTFSGNSAAEGGGAISNWGSLTTINSTFHGNSAAEDGGAILNLENLTTINSTFHGNSATGDGGGVFIYSGDKFHLYNTILAGSKSGSDCFGRLAENIGNLIEDGSCFAELSGDPMLGELVTPEDGSPAYFPLLEGSPAINAADAEHCTETDQIGTARPQGAGCDIGAIEYTGKVSISSGG